jgi:nitroreductase
MRVDLDMLRMLVAEARLAPSVHNIQPTRFALDDGSVVLLGDTARCLPVADPLGHDVAMSHGAMLEGFSLALQSRGLFIAQQEELTAPVRQDGLRPLVRLHIATGDRSDSILHAASRRITWRGGFLRLDETAATALDAVQATCADLFLIRDAAQIGNIARLADRAAWHFLSLTSHRRELLHWMRLSRNHPFYAQDGMNAEALGLRVPEAVAAGLVLGKLFPALQRIGLAAPLTSERRKTASATAIALFHRPVDETAMASGRAFYRAWLAIAAHGLVACPMSALVDWPESNSELTARHPLPVARRLLNVFRIGMPAAVPSLRHARLPIEALIAA